MQAAGEFQPDVVLLDIGLPKLNGYEACRRIREQTCAITTILIAVTGWGQEEDRRRSHVFQPPRKRAGSRVYTRDGLPLRPPA